MELVILIGLQASGKSTFARQHFAATHDYVSKDLRRSNRRPGQRQVQLVAEALQAGRSVVVDNTNPTVAERAALIDLGVACGARVAGYYFPAPASEALVRNRARTGSARVPDVAIYVTRKRLVPPAFIEGFAVLYTVRIGTGGTFAVCRWEDMSMSSTPPPSLYEWAGGSEALDRLITLFYERVTQDQVLAPVFAQMTGEHVARVAEFIAEVFGGPKRYSTEDGGHFHMIARHLDRRLTEAQRRRWVDLLNTCADDAGLPSDPEFRSAFVGYFEWGSRIAVINSQPGAPPPPVDSPMPTWGWGEVKGPYQG